MNNENKTDIIVYKSKDGKFEIDVNVQEDNIWLSRKQIAELFQVEKQDIDYHISNIFKSQELSENATAKEFLVVQKEGGRNVKRNIEHYNLDMIISVGYRVNSIIATRFRQWATQTLKEYMLKGFVLDDERLKNGKNLGKD
ncbi:MAG: RhuM family protein, partial [bacterium]